MDIILGKNGRLYLNESGTPLEGKLPEDPAVFLANPQQGDCIVYDGEKWVPGAGGSLSAMSDVNTTGVTGGDVLTYDGDAEKWKPAQPAKMQIFTRYIDGDDEYLATESGSTYINNVVFLNNPCMLNDSETAEGVATYYPLSQYESGNSGEDVWFGTFQYHSDDSATWALVPGT